MATITCGSVQFADIQAVIFDKDGTLADSHAYLRHLAQKRSRLIDAQIPGVQEPLLMAFGLEQDRLNPAGLMAVGSRHDNAIAAAAYVAETGRDWLEALEIVHSAFAEADKVFQRKADNTPLFEGSLELLQALAAAGVTIGILSADTTANVEDFVACYQLGALVTLALGVEGNLSKPDPRLFQQASQQLGVPPHQTLMIGDASVDIEMAKAAGAGGTIGAIWGGATATLLSGADAIAARPNHIKIA